MAMRDLVDNCGDGSRAANPVLRMIDAFTGEKAAFHEKWNAQERLPPQLMNVPSSSSSHQIHHQPRQNLNIDDFQRFEEAEMARNFDRLSMEYGMDGREMQRVPVGRFDPRMMMIPPQFDKRGLPGPMMPSHQISDFRQDSRGQIDRMNDSWDSEYAAAISEEDKSEIAAFEEFERVYQSRPDPRMMGGPQFALDHLHPANMHHQSLRKAWTDEFEQETSFAELEKYYRTLSSLLDSSATNNQFNMI